MTKAEALAIHRVLQMITDGLNEMDDEARERKDLSMLAYCHFRRWEIDRTYRELNKEAPECWRFADEDPEAAPDADEA